MKTKKLHKLAAATILFAVFAIMAQPMPHVVYGFLENSDGSTPNPECVSYKAYILGKNDTLYYIHPGSESTCDLGTDGIWTVQVASFDDDYNTGDMVVVEFADTCNDETGSVTNEITSAAVDSFGLVIMTDTMNIAEGDVLDPKRYAVSKAYPNPFNSEISIEMPEISDFHVEVYDLIGKKVDAFSESGTRYIRWNTAGTNVESGMYFVKITNLENDEYELVRVLFQK